MNLGKIHSDQTALRSPEMVGYPRGFFGQWNGGFQGDPLAGLQEDVMPRFLPTPSTNVTRLKEAPGTKMVVRRTFLELEEDDSGDIRRTGLLGRGGDLTGLLVTWCRVVVWLLDGCFGTSLGSFCWTFVLKPETVRIDECNLGCGNFSYDSNNDQFEEKWWRLCTSSQPLDFLDWICGRKTNDLFDFGSLEFWETLSLRCQPWLVAVTRWWF